MTVEERKSKRQASFQKVQRLADAKAVTFYEICKTLNFPTSTFTDWKNGRSEPKSDKLIKLADYFGVTVDYFVS